MTTNELTYPLVLGIEIVPAHLKELKQTVYLQHLDIVHRYRVYFLCAP